TGVEAGAGAIGKLRMSAQSGGPAEGAVAAEELAAVACPRGLLAAEVGKSDAAAERRVPRIAREHHARIRVDFRRDELRRSVARSSEHPFDVSGDRKPAGLRRVIADLEAGDLDRIMQRHELHELDADIVRNVFEATVTL